MNNISTKKLSIGACVIAVVYLINAFVYASAGTLTMILQLFAVALECVLAYAMYRERNDTFTKIIVILFALINLNIYVGIIIIFMLIKKNSKAETTVSKLWWIPAALAAVILLISLFTATLSSGKIVLSIVNYIANVLNYAILGYWLVYKLDIKSKMEINLEMNNEKIAKQIAYFDELLQNGTITKNEYDEKISEIQKN